MATPFRISLGLIVAGVVWLICQLALSILTRRHAPVTLLAEAEREEQERSMQKQSIRARILNAAASAGWTGMLVPIALAAGMAWSIISLIGVFLTQRALWSMIVAVPLTGAAIWVTGSWVAAKRKARFDRQLLDVLAIAATATKSGSPLLKALGQGAATSEEPLRSEMQAALDEAAITGNLASALDRLSKRYPSRAFDLFMLALRMNQKEQQAIGDTLQQASKSLREDFELAEEANAEVATARTEFYAILAIMAFIGFTMLAGGDSTTSAAYFTRVGAIAMGAGLLNMLIGIIRAQNIFRIAGGKPARPLPKVLKRRRGLFRRARNDEEDTQ